MLALTMASSGTFLHTGLKLPYYMFYGTDRGLAAREPPGNMLVAMGMAAALCIAIGVFPGRSMRFCLIRSRSSPIRVPTSPKASES